MLNRWLVWWVPRQHPHQHPSTAWEWLMSRLLPCRPPGWGQPGNSLPPHLLTMGEGTRKGAAEQPPFPPAQPELVNRVPEGAALPEPRVEAADGCSQSELMDSVRGVLRSWSRRSVRGRDLCNWSRWTAWGRDLSWLSWGLAHQWNPPRFHQRSVCDGVLCTSCLSSHLWASAHVSFGVIRLQTMTFIWLFNWRLHQ